MKRFLLTFVIVLNLCAFTNPTQIIIPIDDPYYWYNNTKIRLQLNPAETFILFSESAKLDPVVDSAIQRTVLGEGLEPYKTKPAKRNLIWARIKSSEILNIKTEDVIYKAPSFFNSYGEVVTLSNVFYVKLRRADDLAILDKMATKADIEIIGSDSPTSLWYMLSCTNKSDGSSLEMANKFFESGAFAASEPELLTGNQASCTNDPSFGSQWYLKNTGQNGGSAGSDIKACDAWTITKGCANVIVAVADEGVDPGHPDILNLLPGYDAESGGSPAQIKGIHGTHMAGIIGAAHNTTGISGVAPQCKIMPVSFPLNSTTPGYLSRRKQGIKWAAKEGSAWIINLSWNSEVSGLIDDAINLATTTGQGGLGCVVIVSSG
uniref:S8 family serine peptidase n=1 Tax=Dyadobacter sp. TaxID=1914288 RepID=UPI003F6FA723